MDKKGWLTAIWYLTGPVAVTGYNTAAIRTWKPAGISEQTGSFMDRNIDPGYQHLSIRLERISLSGKLFVKVHDVYTNGKFTGKYLE